MKIQTILFLAVLLTLINTDLALTQTFHPKAISPDEYESLVKTTGEVSVIDVRTPEEMGKGHLPGATNIDYKNDNFKRTISTLDKSKTYLLYCKTGIRSEEAANAMKKAGFTQIYFLKGGIEAWQEAEKPIEK